MFMFRFLDYLFVQNLLKKETLVNNYVHFSKIKNKDINFNNDYSNNKSDNRGSNSQQEHKSHPLAYHTSRILDDEIAKLSLKSNDSLIDELDFNDFNLKDV